MAWGTTKWWAVTEVAGRRQDTTSAGHTSSSFPSLAQTFHRGGEGGAEGLAEVMERVGIEREREGELAGGGVRQGVAGAGESCRSYRSGEGDHIGIPRGHPALPSPLPLPPIASSPNLPFLLSCSLPFFPSSSLPFLSFFPSQQ